MSDPFEELEALVSGPELVRIEDATPTEAVVLSPEEHAAVRGELGPAIHYDAAIDQMLNPARSPLEPMTAEERGLIAYQLMRYEVLPALRGVAEVIGRPMDRVMHGRALTAIQALIQKMDDILIVRLA